ncbi:mevalonate kinase [Candidatus Daviesbacteria bacterium]|nr:mevalonate kinase [Candidatus Daviesbacteria bacterium]
MKKITVSAPGKLMLFGEHAVVYSRPCIVISVGQRMTATVELLSEPTFYLNAPDVSISNYKKPMSELGKGDPLTPSTSLGTGIPKGAKFVELAVLNFFLSLRGAPPTAGRRGNLYLRKIPTRTLFARNDNFGIKITTKSDFSSQFGFGSSSASTVCVIKALSKLLGKKLSNQKLFDLSYKTVLDVQGKGSGFDVAAAIFGGTIYFVTGGKIIKPLSIKSLPLIVGYCGIKADTVTIVNQVLNKAKKYPKEIENIYASIQAIVELAKKALLKNDFQTLGELMNFNEGYLANLGVEGIKLAEMIYAARDAGAYGAKLSGAGMGDCMIALAPPSKVKSIKEAITKAGGTIINVKTNAEGVRIE